MTPLEQVRAVLRDHGMPGGLIPDGVVDGMHDPETRAFRVDLSGPCERVFAGVRVRYAKTLSGTIRSGRIEALRGVQAKRLLWVAVDTIVSEGERLRFFVGPVSQPLPRSAFEVRA